MLRLTVSIVSLLMTTGLASADTSWLGKIKCSFGSGSLKLTVGEDGTVSGGMTNGRIRSGSVKGKSISFTFSNMFGNQGNFTGRISGSQMSGTYTQGANSETCTWDASLASAGGRNASKNDASDKELAEAKSAIERAKAIQRQPGCENQDLAARFLSEASVIYRRHGMTAQSDKVNAAADRLTGEGGTYEKCLAKRAAKRSASLKAAKQPAAKDATKPSSRKCLRAKMQLDQLANLRPKPQGTDKIIRDTKRQITAMGCSL